MYDLSMVIEIPAHFFDVTYEGSQIPGIAQGFERGSNCQHFCYEILRHFGFEIDNLRSAELWSDRLYTQVVDSPLSLDLVLFNDDSKSYGAHVGICIGPGKILHLAKSVGKPVIWDFTQFQEKKEYSTLIGIKRPIRKALS